MLRRRTLLYLGYEQGFMFRVTESGMRESQEEARRGDGCRDGTSGRFDICGLK